MQSNCRHDIGPEKSDTKTNLVEKQNRLPIKTRLLYLSAIVLAAIVVAVPILSKSRAMQTSLGVGLQSSKIASTRNEPVSDGRAIFRFDTFGDEQLWTDTLRLHEVIQSSVSPTAALSVGLKVDATALPPNFLATHDLNSPATTVELIKLKAVVGVVGRVAGTQLKSVGITCAICHSTVDNAAAPGVGTDSTVGPTVI
jgi:hypothetical protein